MTATVKTPARSLRRELRGHSKSELLRISEYSAARQLAMDRYVRRSRLVRDLVVFLLGVLAGLFGAVGVLSMGWV